MDGTRISLSSGEFFFVDGEPEDVVRALNSPGLVRVGGRYVNPDQVAQVTFEPSIDTIHTLERLETPA